MIELAALVVFLVVGTLAGVQIQKARSVDYKKRWEEALKLLDDPETQKALKAKYSSPVKPTKVFSDLSRSMGEIFRPEMSPRASSAYRSRTEQARMEIRHRPPHPPIPASAAQGGLPAPLSKSSGLAPDGHVIYTLSHFDRVQLEKKRLRAGNPPRDDLRKLSSFDKMQLLKLRADMGWD